MERCWSAVTWWHEEHHLMARPRPYAASPVAVSLLSIEKAEGATNSEAGDQCCFEGLHGLKVCMA